MSQKSNLHKSPEGWRRFRERTGSGARARGTFMEHRPVSAIGQAVKNGETSKARLEAMIKAAAPEGEFVVQRGRRKRRVRIES